MHESVCKNIANLHNFCNQILKGIIKFKDIHSLQDIQKDRYAAFDPIGAPQAKDTCNPAFGFENSFNSTVTSSGGNIFVFLDF